MIEIVRSSVCWSKFIQTTLVLGLLAGCSSEKAKEVPPQKADSGKVGPFEVVVPTDAEGFKNSFKIALGQNEGKVEYFITQPADTQITLNEANTKVTACAPENVEVSSFWVEDVAQERAIIVKPGERFMAKGGVRGLLLVVFKQLEGCQQLEFNLRLTQFIRTLKPASDFGQSKSALCRRADGAEFMMNFPRIRFYTDRNGFPTFDPGTICYGEKKPGQLSFKKQVFLKDQQTIFNIGPNQTIQLFAANGPIAYVEWGYFPDSNSPLAARGKFAEWYPTETSRRQHDMTCELFTEPMDSCY